MTNAIEQSKCEMYSRVATLKFACTEKPIAFEQFESALEQYLENIRVDLSALHETSRKRFEDIQSLKAVNADLIEQLSSMTEKRDVLRNTVQAMEMASATAGDVINGLKSELYMARMSLSVARSVKASAPLSAKYENASCATLDGKTAAILGAVVDCQRITTNWAMNDLRAKKAIRDISAVVNGSPHVLQAMKDFETGSDTYATWFINNGDITPACQHSFHPAFPSGEQCVFCGVGK